jgi:hypothetical protein
MQYPHKVNIIHTKTDGYGQRTEVNLNIIDCLVIEERKSDSRYIPNYEFIDYDISMVIPSRNFDPYSNLLSDEGLRFEFKDKKYRVAIGRGYNSSSGATKLYQFKLKEAE